jgi:peptidoglycan hydrolase-like amidase
MKIDNLDTGVITIHNYTRSSYAGIPRNTFHGSLTFQKGLYQTLEGQTKEDWLITNGVSLSDYLKGIVETNDQEHLEKNKVMALLAKNYLLFYLGNNNLHPSIPTDALYSAIDSPEMFQKYVGAGAEKTLTKRYEALEATKNQIILYS